MISIQNQGQIKLMSLPPGWIESDIKPRHEYDIRQVRKFHKPDNEDVQLCFYYRGLPISATSAREFKAILDKPPHQLSLKEIQLIQEVLDNYAMDDAFKILSAKTDILNGRSIIIVEGRWHSLNKDAYSLFIDADGTGSVVQEIYFAAPIEEFPIYLKAAKSSFSSIEWIKNDQ